MTGSLQYDADGLRTFAAACEQHALDVCVHDQPAIRATGHQSTVAAVSGLHAATSSTGDVLSARIRSTASALASDRYSQTEDQSADFLAASMDTDTS